MARALFFVSDDSICLELRAGSRCKEHGIHGLDGHVNPSGTAFYGFIILQMSLSMHKTPFHYSPDGAAPAVLESIEGSACLCMALVKQLQLSMSTVPCRKGLRGDCLLCY